jgi:hypothetical protein
LTMDCKKGRDNLKEEKKKVEEKKKNKKENPYKSDSENGLPQGFTFSMACMDALPVIFFACSMLNIAVRFHSTIFVIGAIFSSLAGMGKVLWKILIATAKKNITLLASQFRYLMSGGFLLMFLSLILNHKKIAWSSLRQAIFTMPSLLFFLLAIGGMLLMGICGAKLDKTDAKSNWLEESINTLAQLFLFLGILFV